MGRHAARPARRRAGVREARPSTCRTPTTCSRRSTGCMRQGAEWDGVRVMGLDDFLEAGARADAPALPRVQPRPRARRDAPAARRAARPRTRHARRAAGVEPGAARRSATSSIACRTASPRRLEQLKQYEFEDDAGAPRVREPARGAGEHPRPRGVPAPLRRSVPRPAVARATRKRST